MSTQPFDFHTHQLPTAGIYNWMIDENINAFSANKISVGLHPWKIDIENWQSQLETIESLAQNPNVVAIGECGLDRSINVPMLLQKQIFDEQVQLAHRLQKPVIIHCVRAYDELLHWKKSSKSKVPLVVHGFNNRIEIAQQLVKNGFYFSFGAALLTQNSNASKIISQIPAERIFLETDAQIIDIESIYDSAAINLNLSIPELHHLMAHNLASIGI